MVRGARAIRWVLQRLVLLAIVVGGYFAFTGVQVWLTSRHHDARPVQAIVVMGAAQYDGVPSPDLVARLAGGRTTCGSGIWLTTVVVTGSKKPGDKFTEAQASATWLAPHGVPAGRHRRGRRRRLVDQPVAGGGGSAPAGADQGPDRDRRVPRGPEPGHRLQRRAPGVAGRRPRVPRSRAGRRFPTTPRRRSGWPWAGSSGTRDSTGWASLRQSPIRGWCNRQHGRFWPCYWGFESSPPSQFPTPSPTPWGSGRRAARRRCRACDRSRCDSRRDVPSGRRPSRGSRPIG